MPLFRDGGAAGSSAPPPAPPAPMAAPPASDEPLKTQQAAAAVAAPASKLPFGLTRRRLIALGAVGTLVLVAIVAGAAGAAGAARGRRGPRGPTIDDGYCGDLPDAARGYCSAYYNAAGASRFAAASTWQRMSSITCERCLFARLCLAAVGAFLSTPFLRV